MKVIKQNPMYWYLLTLTIASAIGLQGWRTLFNNFAVEVAGLNGFHIGVIQSVREVPGFLALFAVFLTLIVREQRLSALSVICMGCGLLLTGYMPSFSGLILTTLVMSLGFHYYETTNQSLILQCFDEGQSPLVMGSQRSMMSLVCIIVGLSIFFLSNVISYKGLFFIFGVVVLFAGVWGLFNEPEMSTEKNQHKKMILRKRYSLFYTLTLLSGARRQIFMVFSVLLLVKKFEFSIQAVTGLFVFNNIVNYFVAPLVAKSINRFGERAVMLSEYGCLVLIFTAYAFCPNKWVIILLYVLDHITFNGSMAIRTYFHKIASRPDISSSTAVSFTINHIAAVVLPAFGGYLWMVNYRIPFLFGALLGALSFVCACFVKTQKC